MTDLIVNNPEDLAKFIGATVEHVEFVSLSGVATFSMRLEGKDGGTWEALIQPLLKVQVEPKGLTAMTALNISTRKV